MDWSIPFTNKVVYFGPFLTQTCHFPSISGLPPSQATMGLSRCASSTQKLGVQQMGQRVVVFRQLEESFFDFYMLYVAIGNVIKFFLSSMDILFAYMGNVIFYSMIYMSRFNVRRTSLQRVFVVLVVF